MMIAGTKITIGETEYTVPSLTLKQLRSGALEKIRENDQLITDGKAWESFVPRVQVIGMALRRNYPDLTDDALEDLLDMRNINEVWLAVLGASDLRADGGAVPADPPLTPTTSGQQSDS